MQIIYWLNGGLSGRGWSEFNMTYVFVLVVAFTVHEFAHAIRRQDKIPGKLFVEGARLETFPGLLGEQCQVAGVE